MFSVVLNFDREVECSVSGRALFYGENSEILLFLQKLPLINVLFYQISI